LFDANINKNHNIYQKNKINIMASKRESTGKITFHKKKKRGVHKKSKNKHARKTKKYVGQGRF